jgi:pimeloyl-ACP methyl ester carboxylesterase
MPEIQLSQGTIHYRDHGAGPTVVFIHGLLVNSQVWDRVVGPLSAHARCVVPDLPLGSHPEALSPDADLTPPGVAALIAELLETLELTDVTLVGNDTGGALCQLVCVHHPERISRLVLCNCDAFENFPPAMFRPLVKALGSVPGFAAGLERFGRIRRVRQGAMALAPLTVEPIDDALLRSWLAPLRDRGVRRDLKRFARAIDPRYTLEAAEQLRGFDRPTLLVWGTRDKFFPLSEAERLAAVLPQARIEPVQNARTFVQLDAPQRMAELIASFAGRDAVQAA